MKNQSIFGKSRFSSLALFSACAIIAASFVSSCKKDAADQEVAQAKASPQTEGVFGNGVNLQPSYYNNGNPNFGWSLMKQQTKIITVRIEIEPDKVSQAKTWISQARSNYHR